MKNSDVFTNVMHIVCSVSYSDSIQSDIANFWPGINNTALLVIFAEQGFDFDNGVACFRKMQREIFSIISTWLSCKCIRKS